MQAPHPRKRHGKLYLAMETAELHRLVQHLPSLLGVEGKVEVVYRRPATLIVELPAPPHPSRLERARGGLRRLGVVEARVLERTEEGQTGGLVLSRRVGERIVTTTGIAITVVDVCGSRVRLQIHAPDEVGIFREEMLEQ